MSNENNNDLLDNSIKFLNSDPITALCNLGSLLSGIVAVLSDEYKPLRIISIILLFLLIAFYIYRRTRVSQHRKKWAAEQKKGIEELFEIIKKFNGEYKTSYDFSNEQRDFEYKYIDQFFRELCNCIEELVSFRLGKSRVCVCIKLFDNMNLMNENVDEWKLYTVGRSHSTKANRKKKDKKPVFVRENSDFETIIKEHLPYLCTPNLPVYIENWEHEHAEKFKNSSSNYKYKSTIVFPISTPMAEADQMFQKLISSWKAKPSEHIVGFLCVDSEDVFDRNSEMRIDFTDASETVGTISDILYPIVENIIKCQHQHQLQFV